MLLICSVLEHWTAALVPWCSLPYVAHLDWLVSVGFGLLKLQQSLSHLEVFPLMSLRGVSMHWDRRSVLLGARQRLELRVERWTER